jgi:hypothetical protein
MPSQSPHPDTTPVVRNVRSLATHQNQHMSGPSGNSQLPPAKRRVLVPAGERDTSQERSSVPSTIQCQNSTPLSSLNNCRGADITQHVASTPSATLRRSMNTPTATPVTSAKNISIWADWLRQSGRAPSEPSETPRWRISPRPESIPRVELHIALRSPFRRFFSLCRSPILNTHSGVVANCDHTSEWVHCVHACIRIAMHKDPRNCTDPRNLFRLYSHLCIYLSI